MSEFNKLSSKVVWKQENQEIELGQMTNEHLEKVLLILAERKNKNESLIAKMNYNNKKFTNLENSVRIEIENRKEIVEKPIKVKKSSKIKKLVS